MRAARILWLLPLTLAVLLCWLGARAGLADLYTLHAGRPAGPTASASALAAAKLSTQMAPWRATAWLAQGKLDAAEPAVTLRPALEMALRQGPADPFAWRDFANMLARSEGYGENYRLALMRSQQLAPYSRALQISHALNGLHAWRFGDEATRLLWRDSMRVALATRPREFLRYIAVSRRENFFCAYNGEALGLSQWCAEAQRLRQQCNLPDLAARRRQYCDRTGFLAVTSSPSRP